MAVQARPIDGAEGYALYLRNGGQVELDEINEHLRGLGLREVRPRMLQHYEKLMKHGYRSYMTQNRLDLSIAGESAWSEDLRAQYAEVRRAFPGELVQGTRTYPVSVESLGVLSATCTAERVPTAGGVVVLRLTTTGIERLAVVTRSDKASGRVHLAFDVYTSIPIALSDAPYAVLITFDLPEESGNVAAISDLLVRLDIALARVATGSDQMPRVTRVSMASPLEVELTGNATLDTFIKVAGAILTLRLAYWQSRKAKLEARGIELDNEQKRAALQREVDSKLSKEIDASEDASEGPVLDALRQSGLEVGEAGTLTRREFLEGARAVLALPVQMVATLLRSPGTAGRRSSSDL